MAVNPNIPKLVNAGEPVTAEAWNVIVKGIIALTNYLEGTEGSSLKVSLANPGLSASARVTATRDDSGITYEAVAPVGSAKTFVLSGLRPGPYTIRAEAPGFDAATKNVTLPTTEEISLTLTQRGSFMPAVFGLPLDDALLTLKNSSVAVSRILDMAGNDIAPAKPGAENSESPVLVQIPHAGVPVPPGGSAQLVVAASLEVERTIEMPSLAGLTLGEAQKALEALGLVLGKVSTMQRSSK